MDIIDYAEALNLKLSARYYPGRDPHWTASFANIEIKHDNMLHSTYGEGTTPNEAVRDYAAQLCGQVLVIHAGDATLRRQYNAPEVLTYG